MELILEPYLSVGNIRFDMSREEVEKIIEEKPIFEHIDFLKRIHLGWNDFSIIFNKRNKKVEEITFTPTPINQVIWNNIDILNDPYVVRKLNRFEQPSRTVDAKLYFSLGIALIGNNKDRTLSIFSKKTKKEWEQSALDYANEKL